MSRSPVSSIPEPLLEPIQRGTLVYEWKGMLCMKNPFDLALYLRLLWQLKPATLIEIGSYSGGSAAWFADMTNAMGLETRIISIDVTPPTLSAPRVEFRQGSAADLERVLSDAELRSLPRPWLVIDDASHRYEHCLATLRFFEPWLLPGEYICVEDGIIDSFGVEGRYGGGPNRAIREFIEQAGDRFEIDDGYCDYFGYNATWNTNGFIRRRIEGLAPENIRARQFGLGSARIELLQLAPAATGSDDHRVTLSCRSHDNIEGLRASLFVLDRAGLDIARGEIAVNTSTWQSFQLSARITGALPAGRCGLRAQLHTAAGELIDTKLTLLETPVQRGSRGVSVRFD